MSISLKVRKIMVHIFWSLFGAGVVVLLAAAVRAKQDKTCAGLVIEFSGEGAPLFLTKGEVASMLTSQGKKPLKGKVLRAFDLQQLEEKVEQKIYVEDAEIYFNNQQVLHVKVRERIPVVRVFTSQGNGFFLDTGGRKLPLQHNAAIRLPVFTGYPYEGQQVTREEWPLIKDMIRIGQGLQADPFLMALISTVDYVGKGQFELLPVIGHQVIEWGDGTDTDKKCKRLRQFYQSVISVHGLDYYERIKVQFVGQVIGVRKDEKEKLIDEAAASKQIKEVIAKLQSEQQSQAEQAALDIIEEAMQQEKTSSTKKTSEELKRD